MSIKRGLGIGVNKLIPTEGIDDFFDPTAEEDERISDLREIPLEEIIPDTDQPRRSFNEEQLNALAASIKEHGVVQPIVVVKESGKYKIVAGERRWRASKIAGLDKIPAIVRTLSAQNRLELSLIENVQREDLNAIEIATVYQKFRDQFNLSNTEIAKRVGKSEPAIVNTMRLLGLPDEAKHAMVEHKLSEGQMRPLVTLEPAQVKAVLPKIVDEGWTARRVEQYVVDLKGRKNEKAGKGAYKPRINADAEAKAISKKLGVKVRISTSVRGSGDIVLKFKDKEEFDKICSILTA